MIAVAVTALCVLVALLVRTHTGLRYEHDMEWALGGPPWLFQNIERRLQQISVTSLGIGALVVAGLAVLRRRLGLAIAVLVLVGGANVTTRVLKGHVIKSLPEAYGTSMPSGHATVGVSLSLAVLLVLPVAWHRVTVAATTAVGFFFGAGTVVGHWHHPGDVLAALAVCVGWTGVALLVREVVDARGPVPERHPATATLQVVRPAAWRSLAGSAVIGVALVAFLFLAWGAQPSTPGGRDLILGLTAMAAIALGTVAVYTWVARTAALADAPR